MSTDTENLREKIENEHMRKSDALKALSKAQAGMGRVEELEGGNAKLKSRIAEAEEGVNSLQTK